VVVVLLRVLVLSIGVDDSAGAVAGVAAWVGVPADVGGGGAPGASTVGSVCFCVRPGSSAGGAGVEAVLELDVVVVVVVVLTATAATIAARVLSGCRTTAGAVFLSGLSRT
jgi:hypothetical protein